MALIIIIVITMMLYFGRENGFSIGRENGDDSKIGFWFASSAFHSGNDALSFQEAFHWNGFQAKTFN